MKILVSVRRSILVLIVMFQIAVNGDVCTYTYSRNYVYSVVGAICKLTICETDYVCDSWGSRTDCVAHPDYPVPFVCVFVVHIGNKQPNGSCEFYSTSVTEDVCWPKITVPCPTTSGTGTQT